MKNAHVGANLPRRLMGKSSLADEAWRAPTRGLERSAVRGHWMIENGLHWLMDTMFRDDECRVRTDHAPPNFTTIQHMALNPIRRKASGKKDSLRVRRKVATWNDDYLASLITD
jgi:hypothetical protein